MLTVFNCMFLVKFWRYSTNSRCRPKRNTYIVFQFTIYSFCFFKIQIKSLLLKILLYVSRQRINCPVCILTVVAYTNFMFFFLVDFLWRSFAVSMFIAHATEMVHGSTSMYQWLFPFRISDFCFTVLLEFQKVFSYGDWIAFYNSWPRKMKLFSISGICPIQ